MPVSGCRIACLLLALVCLNAASPAAAQSPTFQARAGQEPITPIPAMPAQDPRRLALGERLFSDRRLSHDNTRSCLSCHDIRTNGASGNAHDVTPEGRPIALNTPTVFNAALSFRLNWAGNFRSLERQAEQTLRNPAIMASSADEVVSKLRADPEAVRQFRDAYGREPDVAALLDAIATYERSLVTPGSRFDRWLAGEADAITPEELSGYQLFKSLGCVSCHQGVNVGGNLFQRHGIFHPIGSAEPALVRVPSLRNVATTPPYFHDGSAPTLSDAVKTMGIAQLDRVLTDQQIAAIVAFLNTLTGTYRGQAVAARHRHAACRHGALHEMLLPGAVGVLLLLALLTWLLLRGIDTNAPAYAVTLQAFDDFALAEASLHRDVLQARAGLLRDYDALVKAVRAMEDAVTRLRSHAQAEGLDAGPADRLAASGRAAGGIDGALQEQQRAPAEFAVLCRPAEHKLRHSAPRTHNSPPQPAHWRQRSSI